MVVERWIFEYFGCIIEFELLVWTAHYGFCVIFASGIVPAIFFEKP